MQNSKIFRLRAGGLYRSALVMGIGATMLCLGAFTSSDVIARRIGGGSLVLLAAIFLAMAFLHLRRKPLLIVEDDGLVLRLSGRSKSYRWQDLEDVQLETASRRRGIRLQLRNGRVFNLGAECLDDVAEVYSVLRERYDSRQPAA